MGSVCVFREDKLQGKYLGAIEFESTPGGQLAYEKDLFALPIVVTANYTTASRDLLETDDFLGNPQNRVLFHYPPQPQEGHDGPVQGGVFL